uniref:Uncharacterized protein n=1 Tax=Arundo donax TaxID=35708 RepID=A0A0A9SJF4_ARUDO
MIRSSSQDISVELLLNNRIGNNLTSATSTIRTPPN